MNSYVVDASVIVGALFEESKTVLSYFTKIFDSKIGKKTIVYSSYLLPFEVANVCRFKLKESQLAKEIYEKFCQLPINYISLDTYQIRQALILAYETQTSVYDASYHLLAYFQGGTFLTCDKEYYQKVKQKGNIKLVS